METGLKTNFLFRYSPLLFEICFFIHLTSALVGWNRKLDDFHGFRQCQTAMGAYYTIQDGFHLDYETPVLGKPWSIPMEFPLFQWLAAATVMVFHTPLDQTGRFWSLAFFYLSLFPLYSLLGLFVREREKRLLILCFVLLNPTYLFWSRTFMMESLVLLLGLLFLWASAKAMGEGANRGRYLLGACLLSALAGVVKVTTWVSCCLPCLFLLLWFWMREKGPDGWLKSLFRPFLYGLVLFIAPFLVTLGWTRFADDVKSHNPMAADFLTSQCKNMVLWNFGTLYQRLSPYAWGRMMENTHFLRFTGWWTLGSVLVLILAGIAWLASPGRRIVEAACLACFLFPLLVFTNLYYVHDYYLYANVLFLCLFLGFSALSLLEASQSGWLRTGGFLLVLLTLVLSYAGYLSYYRILHTLQTPTETVSRIIRENTDKKDVILIYGLDWDPTIPYYSQRKALMDRWNLPLDSPKMQKALEALGQDRIGGMLVNGRRSLDFLWKRIRYFHLSPRPFVFRSFLFFPAAGASVSRP